MSANGKITGVTVVAQNAFDLSAERGLSSFNQEFKFTGDYLWEFPFGKGRRWLTSPGLTQDFLGGWQWSGDWTIASGLPFTPRIIGSYGNVNSGVNGTLRADVTGPPVNLPNPSINEWFNTAAFVIPPAGQYGNARRNSIIGPGEVLFDMAMTKLIPLKETRTLELRFSTTNVFNHPSIRSIDTVLNSPTFGRVISVAVDAGSIGDSEVQVLRISIPRSMVEISRKAGGVGCDGLLVSPGTLPAQQSQALATPSKRSRNLCWSTSASATRTATWLRT